MVVVGGWSPRERWCGMCEAQECGHGQRSPHRAGRMAYLRALLVAEGLEAEAEVVAERADLRCADCEAGGAMYPAPSGRERDLCGGCYDRASNLMVGLPEVCPGDEGWEAVRVALGERLRHLLPA